MGKFVPKAGIEPAHPKIHDFESCASTSSATLANCAIVFQGLLRACPDESGSTSSALPTEALAKVGHFGLIGLQIWTKFEFLPTPKFLHKFHPANRVFSLNPAISKNRKTIIFAAERHFCRTFSEPKPFLEIKAHQEKRFPYANRKTQSSLNPLHPER